MRNFITYNPNIGNKLKYAMIATYLKDDTVRALTGMGNLAANVAEATWTDLQTRGVSGHLRQALNIILGGANSEAGKTKIDISSLSSAVFTRTNSILMDIDSVKAVLDELQVWSDSELEINKIKNRARGVDDDGKPGKKIALKDATGKNTEAGEKLLELSQSQRDVHSIAAELWAKNKILQLAALKVGIDRDQNDPLNDTLASRLLKDADTFDPSMIKAIESAYQKVFINADGKGTVPTDDHSFEALFGGTTVCNVPQSDSLRDLPVNNIITYFQGKEVGGLSDEWVDLIRFSVYLGVMDLMKNAHSIIPSLDKVTLDKLSDNKMINTMLTEAQRLMKLKTLQVGVSAAPMVAFLQVICEFYLTPEIIDEFNLANPTYKTTYDLKELVRFIKGKKVLPSQAAFFSNLTRRSAVKYGPSTLPCYSVLEYANHKNALSDGFAIIKKLAPFLHIMKISDHLWQYYDAAFQMLPASTINIRTVSCDVRQPAVILSQMGHLNVPVSGASNVFDSALIDWGYNRFNAAVLSEIVMSDSDEDTGLKLMNFGVLNYDDYVAKAQTAFKSVLSSNGSVTTGTHWSTLNIPTLAIRKAMPPNFFQVMLLDPSLLSWGATSAVPMPPLQWSALTDQATLQVYSKKVAGKFETPIDELKFEYHHAPPIDKDIIHVKGSLLCDILGISKRYNDAMPSVDTLLSRFMSNGGGAAPKLRCKYISTDSFFSEAPGMVFITVPNFHQWDMYVHYVQYNQVDAADGVLTHDVESRKIRAAGWLPSHELRIQSQSINRLGATMYDFGSAVQTAASTTRVPLKFGSSSSS